FGFAPRDIDYVVLTHAHLDHCGRLPLLAKGGFRGQIVATSATRDLARLVLLDAAGLQAERVRRARRHQQRDAPAQLAVFDEVDVFDAMDHFGRVASYGKRIALANGVTVTLNNASHILGSAWALLEVAEGAAPTRLLFSGDLGMGKSPLLAAPTPAPHADVVVMESTYGDRSHKDLGPSITELRDAISDTLARGGNVVIPTFALERAQEILFYLREMVERGELPEQLNVYLDSPMAISATELFRRHPEAINARLRDMMAAGTDPFELPGLHIIRDSTESIAINSIQSGAVILAGSGMATGGRVLHHLRHNLWRKESSVVFVGYAATGTLARRIIDGQKEVRIYGEEVSVAARIYTIGGFSAHADQQGLLAWYQSVGKPAHTFLVHGEEPARQSLAALLRAQGHQVDMPGMGERVTV
ncbi:MAG: MBL fold metallo-hydrolase, partial [Chloroflexota bacterium]|nr:MBL fold metallo-hydrolase [Chloroflexota bacterium]